VPNVSARVATVSCAGSLRFGEGGSCVARCRPGFDGPPVRFVCGADGRWRSSTGRPLRCAPAACAAAELDPPAAAVPETAAGATVHDGYTEVWTPPRRAKDGSLLGYSVAWTGREPPVRTADADDLSAEAFAEAFDAVASRRGGADPKFME
jgi:hypothetical protein